MFFADENTFRSFSIRCLNIYTKRFLLIDMFKSDSRHLIFDFHVGRIDLASL